MKYLFIISHDDLFRPSQDLITAIHAWNQDMETKGVRIHGHPLRPPGDATTVRMRGGNVVLSNGPFSKSREQICAYELVDCPNQQAAVALASTHPMAGAAAIEVRPIWDELAA
jgi:hypothetical protein